MNILKQNGHIAYLAGGCVRDALLERKPQDFDIASSAKPDEVKKIFPKALEIGRAFGVMIIPFTDHQVEVTTFRGDGDYSDGRHPQSIHFSEPQEDALRRDFTINALFYDLEEHEIIDYAGGLTDLEKKIIRAVGEPEKRFSEDKLRMLRAARFTTQLGFNIESKTLSALYKLSSEIKVVSRERITDEFKKISVCKDQTLALQVIFDSGLMKGLWPELKFIESSEHKLKFMRALYLLSTICSFEILMVLLILHESLWVAEKSTEPNSTQASMPFNFSTPFVWSREERRNIEFLVKGFFVMRDAPLEGSVAIDPIESAYNRNLERSALEALVLLNDERGPLLSELCFVLSQTGYFPNDLMGQRINNFLKAADSKGELPSAFLTGHDLMTLGVPQSPQIKELLNLVYFAQLRGVVHTKTEALDWVRVKLLDSISGQWQGEFPEIKRTLPKKRDDM